MSEWIKCSERKPEKLKCVIVYSDGDPEFAYLTSGGRWIEWHSGNQISPSHWMPLPEPPK